MIIAARGLEYTTEGGAAVLVPVMLYAPEQNENHWECRYMIGWPNGLGDRSGRGIDSVQALELGLKAIGMSLYFSDYRKTGRLRGPAKGWKPSEGATAFPFPETRETFSSALIRGLREKEIPDRSLRLTAAKRHDGKTFR